MKLFRSRDGAVLVYAASTERAADLSKLSSADLVKVNDEMVIRSSVRRTTPVKPDPTE